MHEHGYEQLTTAMVAERAGASIGTVYRYFPDRIAVLHAVASRNLEQVKRTLNSALNSSKPQTMTGVIDVVVDTLVEMFRTEKGFRSLRVGDVLDIRPVSGRGANAEIATVIKDWIHQSLSLRLDSSARLACETAIDVMDALLARAFLHSDRGDQTLIEEAKRMARLSMEGLVN